MLLELDSVSVSFGGIAALRNVSFGVPVGSIVSVIGPNGAGKTTLFNVITGFRRPSRGTVVFDGQRLAGLPPYRIARRGLVRTYQKTEVFPELSVFECVRIGLLNRLDAGFLEIMLGGGRVGAFVEAAPGLVRDILATVGLEHKADYTARGLSYGEQRLLEIAVGLAAQPRLLMLDEPASGLNKDESERLGELICLLRDRGITVLLVEHNMSLVMSISDNIVVLHHGEKIAEDVPEAVSQDPAVVSVYLGREWVADA
jgi:branched-chain amino acid transport system ATP-binding protein